jgi:small-conductance mechanosensitive channel
MTRRIALSLIALVLAGAPCAFGQGAAGNAAANAAPPAPGDISRAPVTVDGETLFLVRGVTSYPAGQRAGEIAARIRTLAADRNVGSSSLALEAEPGVTWIQAGGQRIMGVLDEDARIEQVDRNVLALTYQQRIGTAIDRYREAREPNRLARHTVYSLIATVVLLAAGYIGRRLVRRLRASLEQRYQTRVQDLHIQAFHIVRAKQIWHLLTAVLNIAWGLGVLAMVVIYLRYIFRLFPWTYGMGNGLVAIMVAPLQTMANGLINEIPNLAFLAVLVAVTRYVLKMVRMFFQSIADGLVTMPEFDPDWAWPTYRLVRLLIVALAVIVAYPYVPGSESDAFKGVSLFIGVIFSLGSSSLIGNVIAGYSMTYRSPFKVGDRVQIGNHVGAVERTRLLVTHLRTPKNEIIIVPNSSILAGEVVNFTTLARERGLILHTTVGIGYETPWRQVEAMLIEAAMRTPGLLQEPPPFVLQRALGDFCVTYEINAYCRTPEGMLALYSVLHQNILDVFNDYGVQIMTPAYEADPEQPKVVPKSQWYAAPAVRPDSVKSEKTVAAVETQMIGR